MEPDELEAIDTSGSGDESAGLNMTPRGTNPPAQEDNSGAVPVADAGDWQKEEQPQAGAIDTGEDRTGPNGPIARNLKAFPGNAKRIISYLMGADAAPPQAVAQLAQQIDPSGQMTPSERNLVAVQKTAEEQGPEAAWKLVQANRVAYNAKQAFGYAALNGTPNKRPDLNAAIDAANQAQSHVLDGSDVQFAPAQGGVTATVKSPDGKTQQIPLSMDAFRQYLNVGRNGQYDRVMQDTVPGTLQKLASPPQQQGRIPPKPQAPTQLEDTSGTGPVDDQTNFGKTPSTVNLSGSDQVRRGGKTAVEETNYGDELEARAQRMFPSISQEAQRNQWMAQEEQRAEGNQNKIEVARQTGDSRVAAAGARGASAEKVAQTNAASHEKVADIKTQGWKYASDAKTAAAQIKADQQKAHDGDKAAQARVETARKAIAIKRQTAEKLTPEETQLEAQMAQGGLNASRPQQQSPAPQAPQQQAPAPQKAAAPQQPPVPGAKLYKGTWYTRGPNGESVPYQQ